MGAGRPVELPGRKRGDRRQPQLRRRVGRLAALPALPALCVRFLLLARDVPRDRHRPADGRRVGVRGRGRLGGRRGAPAGVKRAQLRVGPGQYDQRQPSSLDDENYGNLPHPPYYELQSVDSQTAYCTKSDLADCWYYQQRQPPSQYPHPDCYPNYDPAEDVYLAQVFGSITTLEVYYDDLDEISGHSGLSTAYSDWETNTFGNDFYSQASQNCST